MLNGKDTIIRFIDPNFTNLATTTAFTAVENKIPDHSYYIIRP